ncbi:hypothetical protein C8R46DRAFT_32283 [Mycena filopes]|nr:hypothetical protein C8R46DRAFT_32283 [Mycena filopes]
MTATANQRNKPVSLSQYIQFHIDSATLTSPLNPAAEKAQAHVRVRIADRIDSLKTGKHLGHLRPACWKLEETLPLLALQDTSRITFELKYRSSKLSRKRIVLTAAYPLRQLLNMQDVTLTLYANSKVNAVEAGSLRVAVHARSGVETADLSLESAKRSLLQFKKNLLSTKHAAQYKTAETVLKPILDVLEIVSPFLALSGEPISTSIVGLVRGITKSVKEQIAQDADVLALLKPVEHISSLIKGSTALQSTGSAAAPLNTALKALVEAFKDFTDFIVQFCQPNFFGRVVRNPEKAKQLEKLQSRLDKASQDVHQALLLWTTHTQDGLQPLAAYLKKDQYLKRLRRIEMDFGKRKRCNGDEHASTLSSIRAWATSPLQDGKNILWLRIPADHSDNGVRIVTTLHDEFEDARQRGGHVFFPAPPTKDKFVEIIKRGNRLPDYSLPQPAAKSTNRNPYDMIQMLAAHLAEHDLYPPLTEAIVGRIEAIPGIQDKRLPPQFEELLLQPLLAHAPPGPVVFLLDGLDHCGADDGGKDASGEREALVEVLGVLVEGSARFPPNVRLLISGGEGKAIRKLLDRCDRVTQLEVPAAEFVAKARDAHASSW